MLGLADEETREAVLRRLDEEVVDTFRSNPERTVAVLDDDDDSILGVIYR